MKALLALLIILSPLQTRAEDGAPPAAPFGEPNHRIRVCDRAGALVALTPAGRQRYDAFSPGGDRHKNFQGTIQPGKEDASEGDCDVTQFYDLAKPGIYSIQYLYEEYQGGWEGQLWSNVVIIEITAK